MKQYTFKSGELTQTIDSGDHSFIFSFAASGFRNVGEIGLKLCFNSLCTYRVFLSPSHDSVENQIIFRDNARLEISRINGDANIVVRVVKTRPGSFTTYINDELISTVGSLKKKMKKPVNNLRVEFLGENPGQLVIALTVFDEVNLAMSEEFARALRNPETAESETTLNGEDQMVDGQHLEEPEEKEEGAVNLETDRENTVKAREEEVEEREKAVAYLEKVAAERKKALEEKEMALERREKDLAPGAGGGADERGRPTSTPNVNPPDADPMKVSATMAWPRAVRQILGASVADILQQTHDTIMRDWVVARGDNISPNAYDFFVYSHGVAWPHAIVESTTKADLAKVRERHEVIMVVLV